MREANAAIQREKHPIPTIEEVILDLNGATVFSTLDLKAGYHQFELHPESRYITTFSTHSGLYQYKRLMFGVNAASEIFQNAVSQTLAGLPGCRNLSDDIIIYGKTQTEHDQNLKAVLQRLRECNMRLNKAKCAFSQRQVAFFGHIFSDGGVHPDPKKIAAIVNAAPPTCAKDVMSLLGTAQYVARFIRNYAAITAPLRQLTHKDVKWKWGSVEQQAFDDLKSALTSSNVTAYFDPTKKSTVIVDASPMGLGAMLCQDGRVVAYGSRALKPAETRYSQIEREALGVTWAILHFRMYLYGSSFVVCTDHKPLLPLFNSQNSQPNARIELWLLKLQQYEYKLTYLPGKDNPTDYLSRHPTELSTNDESSRAAEEYVHYVCTNAIPKAMTLSEIEQACKNDPVMCALKQAITSGKEEDWNNPVLNDYKNIQTELSMYDDNIILRGHRLIIPSELQDKAVDLAHTGHQGVVKTKMLIREKVWFPGIDKLVEYKVKLCIACQATSGNAERMEPLNMTPLPDGPWQEVAIDFKGPFPSGDYLLVVVDEYSRFPEVEIVSSTAARAVIPKLDAIFARQGIPKIVKSDNGPPFNGHDFAEYAEHLGFTHRKCTPLWPRANGEAERFIRTLVKTVRAASASGLNWKQELWKFLRQYRATPHTTTKVSPSEALNSRKLRTTLPQVCVEIDDSKIRDTDARNKSKIKANADKHLHTKPSTIAVGDVVLVKRKKSNMLDPPFDPRPFYVVRKKGNSITAKRGETFITRNCSFFKKLDDDYIDNTAVVPVNDPVELLGDNPETDDTIPVGNDGPGNRPPNEPQPTAVRRSTRTRKPPAKLADYVID